MKKCIFCDIIKGKIDSHKIYEDKHCFAFLDIHPINSGHILVIPKSHVPDFYELKNTDYEYLMIAVKMIAKKVKKVIKPKKVGLMIAGWDVPHTHVHIVPMRNYHDITSKSVLLGKRSNPSHLSLSKIVEKLKI